MASIFYLRIHNYSGRVATMSETFSERLRRAILDSGMSRYEIAQRSGVDQATLSRFVRGQSGISIKAVDALVETLGLELTARRKRGD
jgi:transcriptional regulator with XRE-family HTH domain